MFKLFVDTSSEKGSLALLDQHFNVVKYRHWAKPEKHTDLLVSTAKELISSEELKQIGDLLTVRGPGSFTGLRVSAAFLKSLGHALKLKITSISSFAPTAIKVMEQYPELTQFWVHQPSLRDLSFRAEFKKSGSIWTEHIDFSGAQLPSTQEGFWPKKVEPSLKHGLQVFSQPQNFALESTSYLDFYPLYLRRSEAEEKFSYETLSKLKPPS